MNIKSFICSISVILNGLILCGCITEFEAKDINEMEGILVVEGIITDDESVITLSQSKGLTYDDNILDISPYHVNGAKVYIECDDGTQWSALVPPDSKSGGQYAIKTGKLNPERQYRLKIEHEEHKYHSEFAYPMATSEIDSVFWTKRGNGQPVNIHVATHAPDSMIHYYRWSYTEVWEVRAKVYLLGFPFYCITTSKSGEILLGTNEGTAFGRLIEIIAKIPPTDNRFMFMYRMDVAQHAISKRAYDYYTNVKKNSRQTGNLFAHIPSELKGNISCITDPGRPVIGYMDVSSAAQKRLYINFEVYEDPNLMIPEQFRKPECNLIYYWFVPNFIWYVLYRPDLYIDIRCVDCQAAGGTSIKELPDDWPYQFTIEAWD